jgi:predicted HicB family RNase H-like nuclease
MLTRTIKCKTLSLMKTKRGRPPIPAAERQSVLLNVRVTRAEQRLLAAEAKRKGLSVSDYMRSKLLGGRK